MNQLSPKFLSGCVAVTAMLVLASFVPLGVVGEWQWNRHELLEAKGSTASFFAHIAELTDRLLLALVAGSAFLLFAEWGRRLVIRGSRRQTVGLYCLLLVAAWIWLHAVQKTPPASHRDAKPYWVLYDPASSGYFFESAFRINSVDDFLHGYEARMSEGEVLHIGTHPPGLFLLSAACLQACRTSPQLVSCLESVRTQHTQEAFRLLEAEVRYARELERWELAALQLLSTLSTVAVALTMIPLAILAHKLFDADIAWRICCLWPTLPCLVIFLPKSDLLFPLTATLVLALMVIAMDRWRTVWIAIPAGAILWLGLMLSLAHLPVVVLLFLFAGVRAIRSRGKSARMDSAGLALLLITTIAISAIWSAVTDCNILRVWQMNLSNHEGFYNQYTRTWWKWFLVNPLELTFAVGLPVVVLSLLGVRQCFRMLVENRADRAMAASFCIAAVLTWSALWISGKNQGEAARLWCFLTPWLLLVTGFVDFPARSSNGKHVSPFQWLLAAQLIAAILTVGRVSGFSF